MTDDPTPDEALDQMSDEKAMEAIAEAARRSLIAQGVSVEDDDEPDYRERRRLANEKREIERIANKAARLEGYVEGREDVETDWLEKMLETNKAFREAYIGALHRRIWELEVEAEDLRRGATG